MRFLFTLLAFVAVSLAWAGEGALRLNPGQATYELAADLDFLEDATHDLTLADMAAPNVERRFRPAARQGRVNFGYSASAYWLRARVDSPGTARWLLEIGYASLDQVDFYHVDGDGQFVHLRSGDRMPFAARPYSHRNLVFPVDLRKGPSTLYLRVESGGNLTVPVVLWQPDEFARVNLGIYAALALYFGTLLALAAYNLLLYFAIRDRAYLEYVLFAVGMAIGLASSNGLAQQFLWPDWPDWGNLAFPIGFSMAGLFGAMFTRSFLATVRTAPTLDRALLVLMGVFAVSVASHLLSYRVGAMLVSLGGLAVSVVSFSAGIAAWRRGHAGARFFLLAWTVLLFGVAVMAMRNFGWLPTNFFTVYAMQFGSTLDLLLLSFALADRINAMRGERAAAQVELIETKQLMLDTLRRSEEELEERVELRTRELEDANARLLDNERTLSRLARQDALTGLGNRIVLEEEIQKAIGRANRLSTGVAVMLIDLDRFKPVNDQHGHGVGDEVLKQVANRLRACTRRTDTAARLGGDEFVVVLEGRNVVTDAHGAAEKIVRCLADPFYLNGLSLRVGASIGIAILAGGESPDDLLRRADQAMYRAKREGGNRYAIEGL